MLFFHIADLHLGKRYNELPLYSDQEYILEEILSYAKTKRPRAVLIAGDVYDKSIPPTDAVEMFDRFLNALNKEGIKVFIISGNHDSPERLAFGAKLLDRTGVHISPVYDGTVTPYTLSDEYGQVNVYCLPFIKPSAVRRYFGEEVDSYTKAVQKAVEQMNIDQTERNVLVAHQFVTGSKSAGSEEIVVGDVGNVDAEAFAPFDYVALGHIHGAQNVLGERVRYCGTPLKYSLSEKDQTKSVTMVELREKGNLKISELPLKPMRDVSEIKGTYAEITAKSYYENAAFKGDLLHITLTDEEEVPDALAKLRLIYPYVMSLKYDNARTRTRSDCVAAAANAAKSPYELFAEFFYKQNGAAPTPEQEATVNALIGKIWGDGE